MGQHCNGKAKGLQCTMYLGWIFQPADVNQHLFFIKVAARNISFKRFLFLLFCCVCMVSVCDQLYLCMQVL